MNIVRRDPTSWFAPLVNWQHFIDEDMIADANRDLSVYETDSELVIKASIAGVPSDNIDVSIESGVVTIRADFEETEEEKKKKKVVYREARRLHYLYTTNIPFPVKAESSRAVVENGILTLTLPKAEEAKPKKIKVSTSKN